jgi:hypothetical protein
LNFLGMNPCAVLREKLRAETETIMQQLREPFEGNDEVALFDAFTPLCPPEEKVCRPYGGRYTTFSDKIHINLQGATQLTASFARLLESKGWVSAEDLKPVETRLDVDFKQRALPFMATYRLGQREAPGRWTDGSPVVLKFAQWFPRHFKLILMLNGAHTGTTGQTVKVLIGNQSEVFLAPGAPVTVTLDFHDVAPYSDTLVIEIPDPRSPQEVEGAGDRRQLGLFISSLHVLPMSMTRQ